MRQDGLSEDDMGVKIGGRTISILKYANDATLLAGDEEELRTILRKVMEVSSRAGLYLNVRKTKVTTTADKRLINMEHENIGTVQSFVLLGSRIDSNGDCTEEVKRRSTLRRLAMSGLDKIWKSKSIKISTKARLVPPLVFPGVMYGCESWTMKIYERCRVSAMEMWCWRRMLRIPWTARVTNEELRSRIGLHESLDAMILKQKLSYFGHACDERNWFGEEFHAGDMVRSKR